MCSARLTGVTSSIPPANCDSAQRKDMMYRYSRGSLVNSNLSSQFQSTLFAGPNSLPMMYQMQASMCPMPNMMMMSFRMSMKTTSFSDGSRSARRLTISPTLASRSKRIMRRMRKIRETLLIRAMSMPSMALPRMISVQSAPTTAISKTHQDFPYFLAIGPGRISMVPSEVTNPETKDIGISAVQKSRVTHSMVVIPTVSSGSKNPKGTIIMS
mmetsp:Transcript_23277/g.66189  ORF Transcript_23277/g.66189 Transcript_23277/m.66189 type:complete len:213 (+) Transcript_23277:1204-1842(+)